MDKQKKILLVYKFDHPDILNIREHLLLQFPGYQIDLLNIKRMVRTHLSVLLMNVFYLIKEYPLHQLMGYWKIWRRFWGTTYIFRQVKRLVNEFAAKGSYLFIFQIHSDFDASNPSLPNFVYTDTTNLVNLLTPGYAEEKLFSTAWRELEKTVYENAQITFVRSTHIQKSLIEQYGINPRKIALVYSGSNAPNRDINLRDKEYQHKNILFVGVAWERKGGPDLLKAFELVLRDHPDAHLTIVGCSPKVALPNVSVVGKIPLDEVAEYYQKATVFCLPTHLEPFGVVFIEAMSFGLPVVAPNLGAIPDFIEDGRNGYLYKPGNTQEIADALIRLLDDPALCRKFGEAGYLLVKERYTWQKVCQKMKDHILFVTQREKRLNNA